MREVGIDQNDLTASGASDPRLGEIEPGRWVVFKNTTSGEVRVWYNDNDTMKKSAAFVDGGRSFSTPTDHP